jgi:hypothetical protein
VTPFVQRRANNRAAPLPFDDLASHYETVIDKIDIDEIEDKLLTTSCELLYN